MRYSLGESIDPQIPAPRRRQLRFPHCCIIAAGQSRSHFRFSPGREVAPAASLGAAESRHGSRPAGRRTRYRLRGNGITPAAPVGRSPRSESARSASATPSIKAITRSASAGSGSRGRRATSGSTRKRARSACLAFPEGRLKNRLFISLISASRTILGLRWIRSRSPGATSAVALSSVPCGWRRAGSWAELGPARTRCPPTCGSATTAATTIRPRVSR